MLASWDRVKVGSRGRNAEKSGESSSVLRGKEGGTRDKGAAQVNKWMGRESSKSYYSPAAIEKAKSHHSAPLTSLTDPSLFPPPPRHVAAGPSLLGTNPGTLRIGAPPPAQPPRQQLQIQQQAYVEPPQPVYAQPQQQQAYVQPPQQDFVQTQQQNYAEPQQIAYTQPEQPAYAQPQQPVHAQPQQQENMRSPFQRPAKVPEEPVRRDPPGPFQKDTTGLKVDHLPPPPRRAGVPAQTPPSLAPRTTSTSARTPLSVPARSTAPTPIRAKPQPPPRLPPRQNSHPDNFAPEPPPVYAAVTATPPVSPPALATAQTGYLNASSLNRLGQAGVSVPGFNISRTPSSQNVNPASQSPAAPPSQVNELQARFARMQKPSSPSNDTAPASSQGTTWAQKQSALQTAANFHQDPSSVSWKDARAAASTANNFRERHGEQVAQGYQKASAVNQKYGVADKVGGYAAKGAGMYANAQGQSQAPSSAVAEARGAEGDAAPVAATAAVVGKKAPPPPPKKKILSVGQQDAIQVGEVPPPLPLASKPR